MSAKDKLKDLGTEGKLVALNCKCTPAMRDLVYDLKARNKQQVNEIIQDALAEYFEGYDPSELPPIPTADADGADVEDVDDDEDLDDEDL